MENKNKTETKTNKKQKQKQRQNQPKEKTNIGKMQTKPRKTRLQKIETGRAGKE